MSNEKARREAFERAAYNYYLERKAQGSLSPEGEGDGSIESLMWRQPNGQYGVLMFNAAWWGWNAALDAHRQQEDRKPVTGWVSTDDRMPDDGQEVLVCVNYSDGSGPHIMLDRWAMGREDPLGLGGPTIETGFTWDNNDPLDVTHWMPLPPAPDAAHGIKGE